MKIRLFVFLIISSFPVALFSQELNIGFESGTGSYSMNDLKELNNVYRGSLPFDARITENFPNYWYYRPSISYSFKKNVTLGAAWSFHSTGSRISLADYSGEYSFDMIINSSSPALFLDFFYPVSGFRFVFGNELGMDYSNLTVNENLKIGSYTNGSSNKFKSQSFYYEPDLKILYSVLFMKIGLSAGYHLDLQNGDIASANNKKAFLMSSSGEKARSNWSGFRIGASLTFNMFRIFNKKPVQRSSGEAI